MKTPQLLKGLSAKQTRFALEYVKDLNATQACIRAGYSEKGASVQGHHLLANTKIAEYISNTVEKTTKAAILSIERLDQEIASIAHADIRKLYDASGNLLPIHKWPDDVARAVGGIEMDGKGGIKKLKVWDKTPALALAARRLGLLKDAGPTVNLSLAVLVEQSIRDEEK